MIQLCKNRAKKIFYGIKPIPIFVIALLFLNYLTTAQTNELEDSTAKTIDTTVLKIPISGNKLDNVVSYNSKDSIVYDALHKLLYLHNGANIEYGDVKINTDYIVYEQDSSRLSAYEIDSLHVKNDTVGYISRLTQGEESSTFNILQYNFKSKRAMVENAYSAYGDGFILSKQVKRNNDNSINGYQNIYTTCNAPHPHFGIAAKKIKIIPNKVAVSGSANLVVEDIPTPLFLPFGLFPLKKGQKSGFKLPTYTMSEQLGFGLREGGYYFAINDHYDLLALADIYTLGSWNINLRTTYAYKYRFNGGLAFSYGRNKIGESYEPNFQDGKNFRVTWSHALDRNIIPGSNFSANVDFGSSKYLKNNTYDANAYLMNTFTSNISYSKNWQGKPYSLSVALRHNQNSQTHLVQLTLPEINFSINQIYPFKFRKEIIKPRWYEKITSSYQVAAINRIQFYDTNFSINNINPQDFQNGIKHTIPVSASYNVLKFFNLSFNANYNEYWYSKKTFKAYNFNEQKLDTNLFTGFFTARDYNLSSSISTRIYGIKLFKKGAIRGIRHVITPSINVSYHPDFGSSRYNYYYNSFTNNVYAKTKYSYYDGAIFGGPPNGKVGGIGFNIGNTLSMKVQNKKDTANGVSKINILDGLNFSSFYNMAVDSFKWSNLAISYRTTLFEKINISGGLSYSPYSINKTNGARSPIYEYKANSKLLRFEMASLAIGATLPFNLNKTPKTELTQEQQTLIGNNLSAYADFTIPYSLSINYSINLDKSYLVLKQKDTLKVNQNINFYGDVNLTPKWKIGFRSGYDFLQKKISYSSFDIYRDLHCWDMRLNLIPFGYQKSYNFSLNVKASILQDLKLTRRKDYRDFL